MKLKLLVCIFVAGQRNEWSPRISMTIRQGEGEDKYNSFHTSWVQLSLYKHLCFTSTRGQLWRKRRQRYLGPKEGLSLRMRDMWVWVHMGECSIYVVSGWKSRMRCTLWKYEWTASVHCNSLQDPTSLHLSLSLTYNCQAPLNLTTHCGQAAFRNTLVCDQTEHSVPQQQQPLCYTSQGTDPSHHSYRIQNLSWSPTSPGGMAHPWYCALGCFLGKPFLLYFVLCITMSATLVICAPK